MGDVYVCTIYMRTPLHCEPKSLSTDSEESINYAPQLKFDLVNFRAWASSSQLVPYQVKSCAHNIRIPLRYKDSGNYVSLYIHKNLKPKKRLYIGYTYLTKRDFSINTHKTVYIKHLKSSTLGLSWTKWMFIFVCVWARRASVSLSQTSYVQYTLLYIFSSNI